MGRADGKGLKTLHPSSVSTICLCFLTVLCRAPSCLAGMLLEQSERWGWMGIANLPRALQKALFGARVFGELLSNAV